MSACLNAPAAAADAAPAAAAALPALSSAWEALCSGLADAEARLLVLAYSGRRLYVPADVHGATAAVLRLELGADLTARLIGMAGGATVDVPSANLARVRRRHLLIRRALREGATAATIAALCDLSERQLRRIANGE